MAVPAPAASPEVMVGERPQLALLGGFRVVAGARELALPAHARRVLAYLGVHRRSSAHARVPMAEVLWPAASTARAQASLRTALWRIRRGDRRLVQVTPDVVRLGPDVQVDLHAAVDGARAVLAGGTTGAPDAGGVAVGVEGLRGELLPGWEEDWLLLERERLRQMQIHALDALSRRMCAQGRHAEAIDAALAAIALEPMREASHAALVAAFVADGNLAAAHRQVANLSTLLDRELAVTPSRAFMAEFHRLVSPR